MPQAFRLDYVREYRSRLAGAWPCLAVCAERSVQLADFASSLQFFPLRSYSLVINTQPRRDLALAQYEAQTFTRAREDRLGGCRGNSATESQTFTRAREDRPLTSPTRAEKSLPNCRTTRQLTPFTHPRESGRLRAVLSAFLA